MRTDYKETVWLLDGYLDLRLQLLHKCGKLEKKVTANIKILLLLFVGPLR